MLSSKAKYAVRAVLAMAAARSADTWVNAGQIARDERIPHKYLEAILVCLRDDRLIESRRGPGGGHRLQVPAEALTVADIIRSIDGPLALTPCASRTRFRACEDCPDLKTCRLRHLMQQARDAVATVLEGCTIAALLAAPRQLEEVLGTPPHRGGAMKAGA
ncbi:MAG: Rrf2 family transcriptional regulator [Alphaproteobacteria bacterium]|nr:Rrf2 family transcriptional regulator [Alphaproteobacteria bacterium]